jgi:hypothetical protein
MRFVEIEMLGRVFGMGAKPNGSGRLNFLGIERTPGYNPRQQQQQRGAQ